MNKIPAMQFYMRSYFFGQFPGSKLLWCHMPFLRCRGAAPKLKSPPDISFDGQVFPGINFVILMG